MPEEDSPASDPPEVVPSNFEQAKSVLIEQFPVFMIVFAEEWKTIEIDLSTNPDYESLILEENFEGASSFVYFDKNAGKIIIEPESANVDTYELMMTLSLDAESFTQTMSLTVNKPMVDEP